MTAPVRGWVVVHPKDGLLLHTVCRTRAACIAEFCIPEYWRSEYYSDGYRCIRVTITPEETK